jgi:hypothetical protein
MAEKMREHAHEQTARLVGPPITVDELITARQKLMDPADGWRSRNGGSAKLPLSYSRDSQPAIS